jgi:hypothetical protein
MRVAIAGAALHINQFIKEVAKSMEAPSQTWDAFRESMPVTAKWAYFDHAAVAPLSEPARRATVSWLQQATAEGDTIWFGEIDYQAEAAALGVDLPALTLLLFGAPGPGAKAMSEYPRMGLDAFCQKVLVYQQPGGRVNAYFNEMPAFAELHHGSVALPHRVINRRMTATLAGAVEE